MNLLTDGNVMEPELLAYFKRHGLSYKSYRHPAVFRVAESSKLTKHIPGLRTKSLFLRDEHKRFYLYCLPAEKRMDSKALRSLLAVKSLEFSTPEELKAELHVTPGSVSPFAIIHAQKTTLLIDRAVWEAQEIGAHPNENTATWTLAHENFARFVASLRCPHHIIDHA